MAALLHPLGHTLYGQLGCAEPKEKQAYTVARSLRAAHKVQVRPCCQCGLYGKCFLSGEQILDALQHSRSLVVICSKATRESIWVQREVETFASYHGRDRILIALAEGEHPTAVITCRDFPADEYLVFATRNGMVKKTSMAAYDKSRRDGIIAINLKKDDELVNVRRVKQGEKIILCSSHGKAILFDESEVRPTGRDTSGVRGITLKDGATMLGMEISNGNGDLFVITEKGYGKRTAISEYPEHKRGGQGVYTIAMTQRKGNLVSCRVVGPQHELMIVSEEGVVIRVKSGDISKLGRSTQGVKVMNINESDRVSAVARMVAHKKKAARVDPLQGSLELGVPSEDDSIDIGGDEVLDETMIDE